MKHSGWVIYRKSDDAKQYSSSGLSTTDSQLEIEFSVAMSTSLRAAAVGTEVYYLKITYSTLDSPIEEKTTSNFEFTVIKVDDCTKSTITAKSLGPWTFLVSETKETGI